MQSLSLCRGPYTEKHLRFFPDFFIIWPPSRYCPLRRLTAAAARPTLRKDKFNEQLWYGWRIDPRELVARQPGAARTPEAQRGARRGGCEAP